MIKHTITKVDGWVEVGAAGSVVAQAISGSVSISLSPAAPDDADEHLAFFVLKPENENLFQMNASVPVWAKSSGRAILMVAQDGA